MWLAQTLSVLSRRMRRRILPPSLALRRRTSPVPRSFHSLSSLLKRKSFARLRVSMADSGWLIWDRLEQVGGQEESGWVTIGRGWSDSRSGRYPFRPHHSSLSCHQTSSPTSLSSHAEATATATATPTHILKMASSSSSPVLVSTCSVRRMTGSKWGSCSSAVVSCCVVSGVLHAFLLLSPSLISPLHSPHPRRHTGLGSVSAIVICRQQVCLYLCRPCPLPASRNKHPRSQQRAVPLAQLIWSQSPRQQEARRRETHYFLVMVMRRKKDPSANTLDGALAGWLVHGTHTPNSQFPPPTLESLYACRGPISQYRAWGLKGAIEKWGCAPTGCRQARIVYCLLCVWS